MDAFILYGAHIRYDELSTPVQPLGIFLREEDAIEHLKAFEKSGNWRNLTWKPASVTVSEDSYLDHSPLS